MFEKTWQLVHVDVSKLTVFNQSNKQPECKGLRAMQKQLCHNEVHSLDIVYLTIISTEGNKYTLQFIMTLSSKLL